MSEPQAGILADVPAPGWCSSPSATPSTPFSGA